MWLFTPDGFYSAVQHKDDPDRIMVRCRAKQHAERLVAALPVEERPSVKETPPPADYRWRVSMTRAQWVYLAAHFAAQIAYLNFKNEAHKRENLTGFVSALHRVWDQMLDFQDDQHADTRGKGRWGRSASLAASHHHATDPWSSVDQWLGRHDEKVTRKSEPVWPDPSELEDESHTLIGMPCHLEEDPDDLGTGYITDLSFDGKMATVVFTTTLQDGTEVYDELDVRLDELVITIDPEVAEEVAGSTYPDEYEDIDTLAAADDGSWPPPRLTGFLRGQ